MDDQLMDAGAQAERTSLAWQRTGFGAMAIGALLVRGYLNQHWLPPWPGLLLMAGAGLAVLILVPQRYRRVVALVRAGKNPVSRAMVPGATVLVVVVIVGIGTGIAVELTQT